MVSISFHRLGLVQRSGYSLELQTWTRRTRFPIHSSLSPVVRLAQIPVGFARLNLNQQFLERTTSPSFSSRQLETSLQEQVLRSLAIRCHCSSRRTLLHLLLLLLLMTGLQVTPSVLGGWILHIARSMSVWVLLQVPQSGWRRLSFSQLLERMPR